MNERRGDGVNSRRVKECSGFDEGHECIESLHRHGWESERWVKNNAKIMCGVCRCYIDIGGHKNIGSVYRYILLHRSLLLHRSSLPALSSYDSLSLLCQYFAYFFTDKIHKLHTSLLINRISTSPHFPPPFTSPNFHPSLVLLLMRLLNSSHSLLTLIVIWILFLHLS